MKPVAPILLMAVLHCLVLSCNRHPKAAYDGWKVAHGNSDGNHYSSLNEIDTANVQQLRVAWEFHTGDADTSAHSQIQCNPIIVDGVMYFTSPQLKLFAVDASTGKQKWLYSPFDSIPGRLKVAHFVLNNSRGTTATIAAAVSGRTYVQVIKQ